MFSNHTQLPENFPFSAAQIQQVLGSPEGRRLLALLQRDGGATLQQAAQLIRHGNCDEARALLEPLMSTGEAAELVSRINADASAGE